MRSDATADRGADLRFGNRFAATDDAPKSRIASERGSTTGVIQIPEDWPVSGVTRKSGLLPYAQFFSDALREPDTDCRCGDQPRRFNGRSIEESRRIRVKTGVCAGRQIFDSVNA